jgi:hypothetical protein
MSKSKGICAPPAHVPARQRGAVILLMLLCFSVFSSYLLLRALNAAPARLLGLRQQQNAEVLQHAREALLGYAAAYRELTNSPPATKGPGYLPCPDRTTDDALAANPALIDPDKEGIPTSNCGGAGLKLGRFPWRYLGTGELTDASGERLWYAVSDNFRYNSGAFPLNSTTPGTLCIERDGVPPCPSSPEDMDDVVAVVIAPGEALGHQSRSPLPRDPGYSTAAEYLENDNLTPADNRFAIGTSWDFNDQLVVITRAELMRVVENRVEQAIDATADSPPGDAAAPSNAWLQANGWLDVLGRAPSTTGTPPMPGDTSMAGPTEVSP